MPSSSAGNVEKKTELLRGRTLVNLFFETSTRTQSSFELAGKRLGADVMNMSVKSSSIKKGETLDRYRDDAQRHAARHPCRAPLRRRRGGAAVAKSRLRGDQRRRRQP